MRKGLADSSGGRRVLVKPAGTRRRRPGLGREDRRQPGHSGDILVVTKLDWLARSLPDARDILDELTQRHVWLSLGWSIRDPTDPVGSVVVQRLAMVAESRRT